MKKPPHLPQRLRFEISGFEGPWHVVKLEQGKLVYETGEFDCAIPTRTEVPVSPEQWHQFWMEAGKAGVWSWRDDYYTPALDGTNWSLDIAHAGREVKSHGSNGYPGSTDADYEPGCEFDIFLKALMHLTGRDWDENKGE